LGARRRSRASRSPLVCPRQIPSVSVAATKLLADEQVLALFVRHCVLDLLFFFPPD
jgi:hypothetical protein